MLTVAQAGNGVSLSPGTRTAGKPYEPCAPFNFFDFSSTPRASFAL